LKIYTRTGDEGETGLVGARRNKDDIRVEAYGTVDECNVVVGVAITQLNPQVHEDLIKDLTEIQHQLFDAGGDLAQVGQKRNYKVTAEMVIELEQQIDRYEMECPEIQYFILPGGSIPAATFHLCRVVARRAERRVVTLCEAEETNLEVRCFLNRLSDLFFTMARVANVRAKVDDVPYKRGGQVFG